MNADPTDLPSTDGTPAPSKKFRAFLISSILWTLTIIVLSAATVVCIKSGATSIAYGLIGLIALCACFRALTDVSYLNGQMGLDKVIQLTKIAGDTGREMIHDAATGGFTFSAQKHDGAPAPTDTTKP